jgi:hypothetical protein
LMSILFFCWNVKHSRCYCREGTCRHSFLPRFSWTG